MCPVHQFFVLSVGSAVACDHAVIVIKFNLIAEYLCLYDLSVKFGRQSVSVCFDCCKSGIADFQSFIAEYIIRYFRKCKQFRLFFFPEALNADLFLIMFSLSVLFAPVPQLLIEFVKRFDRGNRNKSISSAIADLVLHIAFFVAGCRIAEISFKTVMEHKSHESVSQHSLMTFKHLCNSCCHIVKAYPNGYAANMLEYPAHTCQQTFLIL